MVSGETCRIRSAVVGGGAWPHPQPLGIIGRQEITGSLAIGVMAIERCLPDERRLEVIVLAGRLVKRERCADHGSMIGCKTRKQQLARAPGMAQPVSLGHLGRNEREAAGGLRDP